MYAVVIPWVIRCSHMQHNNNNNSNAVCIAQIRRKQQMGCSQCPKRKAFSLALNDFLSTCPLTASRSTDCSTLRGRGQKSSGHRSLSSWVELYASIEHNDYHWPWRTCMPWDIHCQNQRQVQWRPLPACLTAAPAILHATRHQHEELRSNSDTEDSCSHVMQTKLWGLLVRK